MQQGGVEQVAGLVDGAVEGSLGNLGAARGIGLTQDGDQRLAVRHILDRRDARCDGGCIKDGLWVNRRVDAVRLRIRRCQKILVLGQSHSPDCP